MEEVFFESIINSLDEGVMITDLDDIVVFVNKTAEEVLFKNNKEMIGRKFRDLFPDDNVISPLLGKVTSENRMFSARNEKLNLFKEMFINFTLVPLLQQGGIEGAILTLKEHGNISIDAGIDFDSLVFVLSSVAHEIKNPLTGIKASAQLVRPMVNEESLDYIDMIIKETDRLDRVLHDYLNMGKKPVFNMLNLNELFEVSLKPLEHKIKDKGIIVKKMYDPSLPIVMGDESKILQVFINIIQNAIEAMDNKGVLTLRTLPSGEYLRREKKTMQWAIAEIGDNGSGIAREDLKRIFTPYFTSKKNGSGLGLAISGKIINDHGGMIKVESTENRGAVFSIYVPIYS